MRRASQRNQADIEALGARVGFVAAKRSLDPVSHFGLKCLAIEFVAIQELSAIGETGLWLEVDDVLFVKRRHRIKSLAFVVEVEPAVVAIDGKQLVGCGWKLEDARNEGFEAHVVVILGEVELNVVAKQLGQVLAVFFNDEEESESATVAAHSLRRLSIFWRGM